MTNKYIEYLRDNPNEYWFKRKLFGWGWVPVRWQGWFVVLDFVLFLILNSMILASTTTPVPTNTDLAWFFLRIIIALILLLIICYKTGERPRWQWGISKK